MSVHQQAAAFAHVADQYERGRPSYPDELIEWVLSLAGPSPDVLDLAAGTGKLTRLLAGRAGSLAALEPVDNMRQLLVRALPRVEVLEGTAQAIPLPDACLDLVTCAQAFHWFADPASLTEIARVLRPGGLLVLIWNRRERGRPLEIALEAIWARYQSPEAPSYWTTPWREVVAADHRFVPAGTFELPYDQPVDPEGLVDRVLSVSYMAGLDASERTRVAEEVREAARTHGEPLRLAYRTEGYAYRLAEESNAS